MSSRSSLGEYYERAKRLYDDWNYAASFQVVKRGLQSYPEAGSLWELKGLSHYACEDWEIAIDSLERASILIPLGPSARVCLGLAYAKQDEVESAKSLLELLIEDEQLPSSLLLQVAVGLDSIDCPHLAMAACRRVSENDPLLPQSFYDLSYYSARCGFPASTTEALARQAIFLDPRNVGYRVGLCGFLIKQSRWHDAHEVIDVLSDNQIDEIDCRCCLERIAELFQSVRDHRRNILCRQRLIQLELSGGESDCD